MRTIRGQRFGNKRLVSRVPESRAEYLALQGPARVPKVGEIPVQKQRDHTSLRLNRSTNCLSGLLIPGLVAVGISGCTNAPTNSDTSVPVETFEGATESSTSVQDIEPGSIEEGSVEEATDTIAGKQLTSSQVQSPGSVVSFTLINADTDQPIAAFDPLTDGATIVLGDLPTVNLNIRANCDPEQVGSVRFAFDNHGAFRTENFVPYALAGDRKGDYFNWTPFVGTHTLSATPFSSSYANGAAGVPHTIQFNVEAGQTDALTVSSFTLIDADADEPIPGFDPIPDNAVIALSTLPTTQLNVRANTNPQVVGSVRFHVNDQRFRTENVVPYALAGDRNADYFVWDYELGSYEITATPYTNARATGAPGQPGVIAFTLVDTLGCSSDTDCMDDSFCNGVESCQEGACVSGEDPCNDAEICNEDENVCEPEPACFVDSDCDNRLYCDGAELCEDGVCVNGTTPCTGDETCNEDNDTCVAPPECTTNSDCEDNLFCNGSELCEDGKCLPGPTPCTSDEICVEATDACVECVNDLQCNDGLFCTGAETCNDGECVSSGSPCSSNEICNESQNKCDAPDGPMVVSFTLINADTNEPIETFDPFVDGALLNFPDLPTTNLSVRANTDPSPTGSVRFALDDNDNFQTENLLPYAIAGDSNGNYNPWTPDVGIRVLTATPFTSSNGNGTAGTPLSITFFVTDMDDPPNMAPTADAGDNLDVPASTTQVTLNGSGSDADGFIESYEWVQLTGPTATLTNSDSPSVTLSDLQEAVYVFLLRVTDNDGAQGSDEVQVTVGEPENTGVVSGELKTWHKVTVTFDGPPTTESSNTNPFADYRLNVTFTNGARSYTVPGYYAADGNAGETSADSGNKWRVHFLPDAEGAWSYLASFRIGNDIAVSLEDKVGVSTSFDGASGTFFVEPTDKTGRDHRGKGLLQYVDGHHFQFAETGEYYLKGGADSPENFLGYWEFDQTFDNGGLATPGLIDGLHRFEPHVQDWNPGDPTWQGDKGRGIIGALNYLSGQGMNSVYFLTFNVAGGDGEDTWPWTSPTERLRYDCSKLDQWEVVFTHMDHVGIQLHVVTQETENDQNLDGGNLGLQRKLYYRELVARFGHHHALIWNLGEENSNSNNQRKAYADYIRALDVYEHPITVHTFFNAAPGYYDDLYGHPTFEATSLQGTGTNYNDWAVQIRELSASAGRKWAIFGDEQGPRVDDNLNNLDTLREGSLWGNLMGGGAGVEWYYGYQGTFGDVQSEDWRDTEGLWEDTKHALDFFQSHLPFEVMEPANNLVTGSNFCLALPGEVYAVYLPGGGSTTLDLQNNAGSFTVRWYNPREGGGLQTGSVTTVNGPGTVSLGNPPSNSGQDWVVLVERN